MKFSVIIPLFNKAPYVIRALDSVFNQTNQDFEVIVVNDGSTDSGEVLVQEKYGNRINLIKQKNSGVSSARNRGIEESTGEYIAFLDADDYWHFEYLASINQLILSYPELKIFGTSYSQEPLPNKKSDFSLSPKVFGEYFKEAIRNTYFFTSATVYSKDVFSNGLKFDLNLSLGEDLDVLFQAILIYHNALYFPSPMVYYGQEDENSEVSKPHPFERTLFPKIFSYESFGDFDYKNSNQFKDFQIFRNKWVLFNLFQFLEKDSIKVSELLNKTSGKYFFVILFYRLPIYFQKRILKSPFLTSVLRKYLKFCFRYIYS